MLAITRCKNADIRHFMRIYRLISINGLSLLTAILQGIKALRKIIFDIN